MANPIVFDCGGSTRIKRILAGGGYGAMNSLLDVDDLNGPGAPPLQAGTGPLPAGAVGSQQRVNGPFVGLSLMFQDSTGIPFLIRVNPLPASFVVTSNLGQNIRGDFVGADPDLIITLFSMVADPLVEAKQSRDDATKRGRRRYVVENAGAIRTVMINDALPLIFDATNPAAPPIAPGAVGPANPAGPPAAPAIGIPLYVTIVVN